MTDEVLTPVDIERKLIDVTRLLDSVPGQIKIRGKAAAEAKHAAKKAEATAFVKHKRGTGDGRPPSDELCKRLAYLDCEQLWLDADVADNDVEAAKEAGRDYREASQNWRSINVNTRALVQ